MLLKDTFVHHVHLWLKDKGDIDQLIKGLHTLTAISYARQIHIGRPANNGGGIVDDSYDASLLILFDNAEAERSYDADPIHQKFVHEVALPLCSKIMVQDSINA